MGFNLYFHGILCAAIGIFITILGIRLVLKIKQQAGTKKSFYERERTSLFQPTQDFNVFFYALGLVSLIVMLFLVFLFLWVCASEGLGIISFLCASSIFLLLAIGYLYTWKKGLFE